MGIYIYMEIFKIFIALIGITLFKTLSWIQLFLIGITINFFYYIHTNKDEIKKHIKELNSNLNFKNSLMMILYGLPLILLELVFKIFGLIKSLWLNFKKTGLGKIIVNYLNIGDRFIINKKEEMKRNVFKMMMNNAMSGLGNINKNNQNNNMPFGNMPDIGDLLKNPEEMNNMMKSFGNIMKNMNQNKTQNTIRSISSPSTSECAIEKPRIDNDLFSQINDYIDDDSNTENLNISTDKDELKKKIKKKKEEKSIKKRI